ncbi:response regulator [Ralstonia solanacearum]|uniref:Response regulator n=3 Tax=Ralstonia TaxID=48736 RepID=A0AAD0WGT1_RALSL|nr:two-component system response regulator [Ralstonia solanacearum]QUP54772.1 response regulator [Ralstonia syzygii]AXV77801.1 response regulator [Ralstonia solanacearum]AXV82428.1 response regulator [Ralstonia solanacearum]AXV87228.1 response regulator [Ralstonia solanacearum]
MSWRPVVAQRENMMQSARVEQLTNSQPLASSLAGRKVLVIDDSSTIRRTAQIFLSKVDCQVVLAEDGFDALAKLGDFKPDIVFCDILMPKLDGYLTCSLIKKSPKFHATPVVMLSSRDGVFDRARGKLVGAVDHLAKPFSREALLEAVQMHLPAAAGAAQ